MTNWNYDSKKIIKTLDGRLLNDKELKIKCASTISNPQEHSILFFTNKKWKKEYQCKLSNIKNSFVIIEPGMEEVFRTCFDDNCVLVAHNARLYFAKALKLILEEYNDERSYSEFEKNVIIGENVQIGEKCIFSPFVFIDHNVVIGNNVRIMSGAKIKQNVIIGDNVIIGENSVIGAQGFGIERDEDGRNIRIPHIGGVLIGENVEIGALSSIVAGTIFPTIIGKNCFIDDLNHIAHNCFIGEGTLTTAAVQIGGSAKIGANSYIAPNATIRNGIEIGENSFVGQASSVQKSYGNNVALVGNPARLFKKER